MKHVHAPGDGMGLLQETERYGIASKPMINNNDKTTCLDGNWVTCSPCINPFNLHTAMTQSGFHLSSLMNNFYVHSHLGCWFTLMKI